MRSLSLAISAPNTAVSVARLCTHTHIRFVYMIRVLSIQKPFVAIAWTPKTRTSEIRLSYVERQKKCHANECVVADWSVYHSIVAGHCYCYILCISMYEIPIPFSHNITMHACRQSERQRRYSSSFCVRFYLWRNRALFPIHWCSCLSEVAYCVVFSFDPEHTWIPFVCHRHCHAFLPPTLPLLLVRPAPFRRRCLFLVFRCAHARPSVSSPIANFTSHYHSSPFLAASACPVVVGFV